MTNQFFGKIFWTALCGLVAAFGLAVLVFETPAVPYVLALVSLVCAVLTFRRTEAGLLIAFAELFGNSHGHLISLKDEGIPVGLRIAVFAGVMAGWGIAVLARRTRLELRDARLRWFAPLFLAAAVGGVNGLLSHPPADAFADGNAYAYLLYLFPILSVSWDSTRRRALLQVFAAGAVWIATLTLGLFFVFSHVPEFMLGEVYRFVRDTRTGELTKMIEGIFRVFLQGQFSIMALIMLMAPGFWLWKLPRREWLWAVGVVGALLSAVWLSLSRSFWVGATASSLVIGVLLVGVVRVRLKPFLAGAGRIAAAKAVSVAVLLLVLFFPYPQYRSGTFGGFAGLFSSRTSDTTDAAIDSRWKLLGPMQDLIGRNPVLGYGFGRKVTFVTDDPRIRAERPDGLFETYALEWGWLELWLKMGLLGPLAFLFLFWNLLRSFWTSVRSEQGWLSIGFIAALAMLAATHMFSPYLNHPIGLGFLMLATVFAAEKKPSPVKGTMVPVENLLKKPAVQPSIAPAMSE